MFLFQLRSLLMRELFAFSMLTSSPTQNTSQAACGPQRVSLDVRSVILGSSSPGAPRHGMEVCLSPSLPFFLSSPPILSSRSPPINPDTHSSFHYPPTNPFTHPLTYPPLHLPSHLSTYLPTLPSIHPSTIHPLSIHLFIICPSIHPSTHQPIHSSTDLPTPSST